MPGSTQRQLVRPRITEVSGVDRPAHMRDGWFMKKSVDSAGTDALLAALGRGARMPKTVDAATASTLLKSLTGEQRTLLLADGGKEKLAKALTAEQTDAFTKAADAGDLQPVLDQLAAAWSALRDLAEKEDPDVPSTEVDPATGMAPVTPAAPDAAAVLASPALAKSLGFTDEGVAMLKAMHERAQAAETERAEVLEKSLDAAAVTAFSKAYAGLDLDAETVAPALRKFAASSPDAAKAIEGAMAKALERSAGNQAVLLKQFGVIATPAADSPQGTVQAMAKSLVDAGRAKTIEQGVLLAYQEHPDLYESARNAGGE